MNSEVKQKWVEALRSGEYEQGRDFLNKGGKFCCLGVLTDLYLKEHEKEWKIDPRFEGVYEFGETCSTLPGEVQDWADFKRPVGWFSEDVRIETQDGVPISSLVACNDSAKLTFPQIADIIEAFL